MTVAKNGDSSVLKIAGISFPKNARKKLYATSKLWRPARQTFNKITVASKCVRSAVEGTLRVEKENPHVFVCNVQVSRAHRLRLRVDGGVSASNGQPNFLSLLVK